MAFESIGCFPKMKNFILMNGLELDGKELQAYYYVLSKKQKCWKVLTAQIQII